MDIMESTKSPCNTHHQRPRKRWFRRGPALHKDTAEHLSGQGGYIADTWRAHGGQGLEARPKRTQGRHAADKVWRHGQSGHKADTRGEKWRTHGGQALGTRPQHIGGHMRTHGGQSLTSSGDAARACCGQPFFPKREPHCKLFREQQ